MRLILTDYDPKDIMRMIREWADLDRASFGETVGCSEKKIKNWETGETAYSVLTLQEIAKKHKLTIPIEKK